MSKKRCNIAKVKLRSGEGIYLPTTGANKPSISPTIMGKWQHIVDLAAKAINVPAGLIMRLNPENMEVCISSRSEGNPYQPMEKEQLGLGLYCETVVATRDALHVPDALADDKWKDNPDVKLDMISYLGMPLKWPDGEVFGTICVLDNETHTYSDTHIELLAHFRLSVETDLQMLLEREHLKRLSVEKDLHLREAHHRIKNHLNMITGVLQIAADKKVSSQAAVEALIEDIGSRIRAIASLHSHIAMAEGAQVSLEDFLLTVAETIIDSIAIKDISLHIEASPLDVDRPTFFHCGILISELITNAVKHAFDNTDNPEISITLEEKDEDSFLLRFKDNGCGLPEGFDIENADSIGMMLISDLPGTMGGSWSVAVDDGTTYEFVLNKRAEET